MDVQSQTNTPFHCLLYIPKFQRNIQHKNVDALRLKFLSLCLTCCWSLLPHPSSSPSPLPSNTNKLPPTPSITDPSANFPTLQKKNCYPWHHHIWFSIHMAPPRAGWDHEQKEYFTLVNLLVAIILFGISWATCATWFSGPYMLACALLTWVILVFMYFRYD